MGFSIAFILVLLAPNCDAINKKERYKAASGSMVEGDSSVSQEYVSVVADEDPSEEDEKEVTAIVGNAFTQTDSVKLARSADPESQDSGSAVWLLGAGLALAAWWAKSNPDQAKEMMGKALDSSLVQEALAVSGIQSAQLDFLRNTKQPKDDSKPSWIVDAQAVLSKESLLRNDEPNDVTEESDFQADVPTFEADFEDSPAFSEETPLEMAPADALPPLAESHADDTAGPLISAEALNESESCLTTEEPLLFD